MKLDRELHDTRSAYWDREIKRVRGLLLLVEGEDDRTLMESALEQRRPTWSTRVTVMAMGSRKVVLDTLRDKAVYGIPLPVPAFGLVDRDLWSEAEVEQQRAQSGDRLFVTPGWCIENSLFVEAARQERWGGGALPPEIEAERENFVRAGAWWTVFQEAREALGEATGAVAQGYGAPPSGLDLQSPEKLLAGLSRLDSALDRLRAAPLAQEVCTRAEAVLRLPVEEQLLLGIHGKEFFRRVWIPFLNQKRGTLSESAWRRQFAPGLARQAPFDEILAVLLA